MNLQMKYMIVDFEATSAAVTGISEIIEFGYAIVEDGDIVEKGTSFIKPVYSSLDYFIEELTSISDVDLENAPMFEDFLVGFASKYTLEDYVFVSWGAYDHNILRYMCNLWNIEYPPYIGFMNLKREHKMFYGFSKEKGMAKALAHANIELEGTHHRGGDDANNIAKLFIDMMIKDWDPATGNLTQL